MQMPRFKCDALGGSRATSGKNNRQLNNGTASFMETTPEIDRPKLPTEMANAPPSAPPPSDGKGFVYWARFDPPLQTRAYPHLGDHVLVGWLLLTERPLPPMATFNVRRREADMHAHHSVDILPWSSDGSGAHTFDSTNWVVGQRFHDILSGWVKRRRARGSRRRRRRCSPAAACGSFRRSRRWPTRRRPSGGSRRRPSSRPTRRRPSRGSASNACSSSARFPSCARATSTPLAPTAMSSARAREAVAARRAATAAAASGDEEAAAARRRRRGGGRPRG